MIDIIILIIGFLATSITTISTLPQIIKTFKTKETKDLSLGMYIILNIGLIVWLIYGIILGELPIIIGNIVSLCLCIPILIMIIYNKEKVKKE